jgi:hypothetical protein
LEASSTILEDISIKIEDMWMLCVLLVKDVILEGFAAHGNGSQSSSTISRLETGAEVFTVHGGSEILGGELMSLSGVELGAMYVARVVQHCSAIWQTQHPRSSVVDPPKIMKVQYYAYLERTEVEMWAISGRLWQAMTMGRLP